MIHTHSRLCFRESVGKILKEKTVSEQNDQQSSREDRQMKTTKEDQVRDF